MVASVEPLATADPSYSNYSEFAVPRRVRQGDSLNDTRAPSLVYWQQIPCQNTARKEETVGATNIESPVPHSDNAERSSSTCGCWARHMAAVNLQIYNYMYYNYNGYILLILLLGTAPSLPLLDTRRGCQNRFAPFPRALSG